MKDWVMTIWHCFCGRQHAYWWKSTRPPSCPLWKTAPKRETER